MTDMPSESWMRVVVPLAAETLVNVLCLLELALNQGKIDSGPVQAS